VSTFIKYEDIPFQEFLNAYQIYAKKIQKGFLIDINKMREFLFKGYKTRTLGAQTQVVPIKIFYIIDFDIMRSSYNHFFLFQSLSESQDELEKLAKRFKIELKLKNIDSLFRIDPKYGLIVGTSHEAIDPAIGSDKLYCFITLYLTSDHHHPEIALSDYLDKESKRKYVEIFEKHNHCPPGISKILGFDLSKIRTALKKTSPATVLNYDDIVIFGNSLIQKHKIESLTLSLIFEDITDEEATLCMLDKKKSAYFPAGLCKFFINIDELFNS
jgi:hypothetical protein